MPFGSKNIFHTDILLCELYRINYLNYNNKLTMRLNGGGRPHGFHHNRRTEFILLSVHVVVCSTYFLLLSFVGNTVLVHIILKLDITLPSSIIAIRSFS